MIKRWRVWRGRVSLGYVEAETATAAITAAMDFFKSHGLSASNIRVEYDGPPPIQPRPR